MKSRTIMLSTIAFWFFLLIVIQPRIANGQEVDRANLLQQYESFQMVGNYEEAAKRLETLRTLEQEKYPDNVEWQQQTLHTLIFLHLYWENLDKTIDVSKDLVRLCSYRDGKDHWRTIDARVHLDSLTAVSKLDDAGKAEFHAIIRMRFLALNSDLRQDYQRSSSVWSAVTERFERLLGPADGFTIEGLEHLGLSLRELGKFPRAIDVLNRAIDRSTECYGEKHPKTASCKGSLAYIHQNLGDFSRTEALQKSALETMKATYGSESREYATALNNVAFVYMSMGEHVRAEPLFRQSLALRKKLYGLEHRSYGVGLNNLGLVLLNQGQYTDAAELFRESCKITLEHDGENHPLYAMRQKNLALCEMFLQEYETAMKAMQNVVRIRRKELGEDHIDYAESLIHLAEINFAIGEIASAGEHARKALDISTKLVDDVGNAQTEREQLALLRRVQHYFDFAISGTQDPAEAFAISLKFKGVVLQRQAMRNRQIMESQFSGAAELRSKIASVSSELGVLMQSTRSEETAERVRRLSSQRDRLERQMNHLATPIDTVSLVPSSDRINEALPADTALIDFFTYWKTEHDAQLRRSVTAHHLAAFVVRKNSAVQMVDLGIVESTRSSVTSFRRAIQSGDTSDVSVSGVAVSSQIWKPIVDYLDDIKNVLVVPDADVTSKLPFAALPIDESAKLLIERYRLVMFPSARFLLRQKSGDRKEVETDLLVVGGVDFNASKKVKMPSDLLADARDAGTESTRWRRLPGTAEEADAINQYFQSQADKTDSVLLKGEAAKESAVKDEMSGKRFVHLATHGFFTPPPLGDDKAGHSYFGRGGAQNYFVGLQSGLVFAGANAPSKSDSDGILTALEIESLDLTDTELVVLSACETGIGKSGGSEGVLGLQRAFLSAGSDSVITSLWRVNDNATQVLMTLFYENLLKHKMSKADALREAQLWMLNNPEDVFDDQALSALTNRGGFSLKKPSKKKDNPAASKRLAPKYWAAFSLSGDWK